MSGILMGSQLQRGVLAPILGNYPNTSISLSANAMVTPDAAPSNTTGITVSTSTNFNGTLEGNPLTGVVRVTDAYPAGTYHVTVRAFDAGGASVTKTFTLTVTTPATCIPVSFAPAMSFATGSSPFSVAVGDFNGDGKQDLAVANYTDPGTISIFLGNGVGGFTRLTDINAGSFPFSIAVGDFNGDGKQDLAVVNATLGTPSTVAVLLGSGNGTFSAATYFAVGNGPTSIAMGDFNGDGKQDLAVTNFYSSNVSILLGDGAGHFSAPTNFPCGGGPYSIAVGDFNRDGNQDLAVANSSSPGRVSILLGDGAGNFSAPTQFVTGNGSYALAIGDFNGDGNQ
ncbi:MAG: FG-GAP repeat domain-containing protein, partial [Bryobacteraceae bacterium]